MTPAEDNLDHAFNLTASLTGDPALVSLQSINFPTYFIAPITTAEPGRLGVAQAPAAADASWALAPAPGGRGYTLSLPGRGGLAMAVGGNLTGSCAGNYDSSSASVYLQPAGSAWLVSTGPPMPVCTIAKVYDQSAMHNDLVPAAGGGAAPGADRPVDAQRLRISAGGHSVIGMYFGGGQGYRNDTTTAMATGDAAETLYMVVDGRHYNDGCCFDYGNAETNNHDDGAGTMECVYFGSWNAQHNGGWCGGAGDNGTAQAGPWVMADLENGLWACGTPASQNPNSTALRADFVVGMVKGGSNDHWGVKQGDAATGPLVKTYEGPRPPGYNPMKKQGAILLGIGGDNSNSAIGSFFEGAIAAGFTSDATDEALMASIVAAGYGA